MTTSFQHNARIHAAASSLCIVVARLSRISAFSWCLLALAAGAMPASAYAGDTTPLEARKIEYLIAAIETLPNAKFIRNGTAYDAKSAADHLRLKLRSAGSKVASAEDFIRLCASVSSVTGAPYQIRFADGQMVTSETFLRQKLAEFEKTPGEE